jgi:hypothetical protein
MLFTLASTFAFSALMTVSPGTCGWGFATPSIRPPGSPTFLLATPVVVLPVEFEALVVEPLDPEVAAPDPDTEPDELAVPTVFVPGEVGTFDALPAPLGSFAALFNPPGLAGPLGTPLTAAVPAPVEPAIPPHWLCLPWGHSLHQLVRHQSTPQPQILHRHWPLHRSPRRIRHRRFGHRPRAGT